MGFRAEYGFKMACRLTFFAFRAIFAVRGGSCLVDLLNESPADPL